MIRHKYNIYLVYTNIDGSINININPYTKVYKYKY